MKHNGNAFGGILGLLVGILLGVAVSAQNFKVGRNALFNEDYETAFQEFLPLAEMGGLGSQIYLGWMYYHGEGTPKNYKEASKWWRMAAVQTIPFSKAILEVRYVGEGISRDYHKAAKWFRLAAEQGHDQAELYLSHMFSHGYGVTRNYEEAVKWLLRTGVPQGQVEERLGGRIIFFSGEELRRTRLQAEKGRPESQFIMASMYYLGESIPYD